MRMKFLLAAALSIAFAFSLQAQQTWDQVYSILNTNCAISSCHGGTTANPFDMGANSFSAFSSMVNVDPTNPAAKAAGYKLVDPGHPYNSYLLKKIGDGFDSYLDLEAAEGNVMPSGAPALADNEIELIRQWILQGAPQTGNVVDTAIINEYYSQGGFAFLAPPPAPADTAGFQVRLGPLFLDHQGSGNPNEMEWLKKDHMALQQNVEVDKIEAVMNSQSHHFLLFKFNSVNGANQEDDGMRIVNLFNTATDGDKELNAVWQYDGLFELPAGTAFFWDSTDWIDMNYHVRNYSSDSILPVDVYLNVYTKPAGSGAQEMKAELVNNPNIFLMPGQNDEVMYDTWSGPDRRLWMLSSHTHKYGTDFDIYIRNTDNSAGEQLYEGFFNEDYTFNQGYYDWEHPAIRLWDTLKTIPQANGFRAETEWYVTQGSPVTFGLTTNDEMQLFTYLYVDAVTIGDEDPVVPNFELQLWPNPTAGNFHLKFEMDQANEVSIDFVDLIGRRYPLQSSEMFARGSHEFEFGTSDLPAGIGLVVIQIGEERLVRRIQVQ